MNVKEIARNIADKGYLNHQEAKRIVHAVFDEMQAALARGESIRVQEFGTIAVKDRKPRVGRNINTNEPVQIPAHKTATFTPCAHLKNLLNP
jgi:DNA-binding protein HU-alpha